MQAILKFAAKRAKTLVLLALLIPASKGMAQQDAMYSQYMFNMLPVNPAYAGSRDVTSMSVLRRWQWSGIEGAPKTTTFSADMPITHQRMGLGVVAVNDQIGVTKSNSLYFNYAYRLKMANGGTLAFGLMGGFTNYQANLSNVTTTTLNDPSLSGNTNTWMPNVGAGVYYSTKRFYAGFSSPHMINNALMPGTADVQRRHYFLMGGYVFPVSRTVDLKPSFLVKYVSGAPMQLDMNMNAWFNQRYSLGVSYRTGGYFVAMTEWQITDQLRVGYAYDMSTTAIQTYAGGSHELLLRFEFGFNTHKMITPRYF